MKFSLFSTGAVAALLAGTLTPGAAAAQSTTTDATAATAAAGAVDALVVTVKRNYIPNLTDIAGSASVITADQVESGRVANISDALRFQPGLLAQSLSGAEATRLSMRGSGIIRGPASWGTGIQMLYDGLPLTTPEGSPFEYYEGLANNYIEVYRGANAFDYAPTTQGGAINYVPHTGYDASPLLLRAEVGSFGYNRQQISSGAVIGPVDYYVSATHFAQDGFRDRNRSYSQRFVGNITYKILPNLQARLHVIAAQQNTANVAGLTWAQLKADPTFNPTVDGNRRSLGSVAIAGTIKWDIDEHSRLSFGTLYKNFPLRNQGGSFPARWDVKDLSTALRFENTGKLFGRPSETLIALLHSTVLPDSTNKAYNRTQTQLVQQAYFLGDDLTFLIRNELEARDGLWITTGLAFIDQFRKSNITFPVRDSITERYSNVTPRIGIRYEPNPDLQFFANVSESVEAPIAHQLPQTRNNRYAFNRAISEQTQITYEVGGRGRLGPVNWSLAAFRARIRGEILTVQIEPATSTTAAVTETSNARSPTIHQGIEAAADAVLWSNGDSKLTIRHALTLNDFYYQNDPVYRNNTLPGVPKAIYQAGLDFNHSSGFYVGADLETVLSKYPGDFANTIFVKPYVIVGAKVGWQSKDKGWQVFLEARNLTDKVYAAVIAPTADARGLDSAVYSPGIGRNINFGITRAF